MLLHRCRDTIHVNQTDNKGRTPLWAACNLGRKQVVEVLLDKIRDTVDVNQADKDGFTPLLAACLRGHKEIVEVLLDKARDTIDVNQANNKGNTPLLEACAQGLKEIVTLLLSRDDVDINPVYKIDGVTINPLSTHIMFAQTDIAKMIREYQVICAFA